MGGLHLFDFNHSDMAKIVPNHNQKIYGGLEAPRNSLEMPVEMSQYYSVAEEPVNSYQLTHQCSCHDSYPIEASMKKLISEEISKGPKSRRTAPSVVARLMGMDNLPMDAKAVDPPQVDQKNEKSITSFSRKKNDRKGSSGLIHWNSKSFQKMNIGSFHHSKDIIPSQWGRIRRPKKPKPREHPQEEELQKFKKEFEAWQAARFRECSRVVDFGGIPSQWLAQEDLNEKKITFYADSRRLAESEKAGEVKNQTVRIRAHEESGLRHDGGKKKLFPAEQKEAIYSRSRTPSEDFGQYTVMNSDQKRDGSNAPTRIVILRPGLHQLGVNEESWASSSGTSEERGSIEDFLEEVKERLKCELQGKSFKMGTMVRGGGIETPYSEKPSDKKQVAQRLAKQVKESLSRDLEMNFLRSESTRSYKSEIQYNRPGSPEFISEDTRRFLSERLRNVLKRDSPLPTTVYGNSRYSMLDNGRGRLEQSGDVLNAGNIHICNHGKDENDKHTRSFRARHADDNVTFHKESSPTNLIRSLSAPVSGTSFGRLLLEDRHIVTGAHIRRKHEAVEKVTVDAKKQKKERFSIREKVSSLKYSFGLKGRLFGRKIQSVEKSQNYDRESPSVAMNFSEKHENWTEVPPSPVSVCSSAHEDLWRAVNHLSPSSASDPSPLEDFTVPHVFTEISSNLNELRRQLYELGTNEPEEKIIEEQPLEAAMVEIEDEEEAYIRDLIVAAKLYDGSSDRLLPRWDPLAKHISNQVFEEVEESYWKMTNNDEVLGKDYSERTVDHRVLFELLNEALTVVLGPPVSMSRFRKKAIGHSVQPPPRGRELLDRVWEIIRAYLNPPTEYAYYYLDSMVARDLASTPWAALVNDVEDIDVLGKELETQILRDLIKEIVKDLLP